MNELEAMRLAIEEAKKGYGFVSPNPVVGCVILDKNGQLLSAGYHSQVGKDHAEVDALRKITDTGKLDGAHVLVTLEPCSHFGRTPPCADRLAQLPIKKLTYGLLDPNPQVSGRGVEKLREKGIEVRECVELRDDLQDLAEIFLFNMVEQRAFVALKVATSLDGALAFANGESKWITSEAARHLSHALRGQYDAVMVGSRTVTNDDPQLDVRHETFKQRPPNKVIILDPEAMTLDRLQAGRLTKVRPIENIFVVTSEKHADRFAQFGVNVTVGSYLKDGSIDLKKLTTDLFKKQIYSVYVEGGAETLSNFVKQRAAQRLYQFIAPKIFGAEHAKIWTQNVAFPNMQSALQLRNIKFQVLGTDVLISARFP